MQAKNEFIEIYKKHIKREGADKLLEWLLTTDFFESPASTRFHSNFDGGLAEHCVKVYKRLAKLVECEGMKVPDESIAIIALLHDICKVGTYKKEIRGEYRVIDGRKTWVDNAKTVYTVEDSLPYGHGEKSVYMISGYMKLTREEAMAINWHMGPYDARNANNNYTLSDAFKKFPLALIMFLADISATYLDEEIK